MGTNFLLLIPHKIPKRPEPFNYFIFRFFRATAYTAQETEMP